MGQYYVARRSYIAGAAMEQYARVTLAGNQVGLAGASEVGIGTIRRATFAAGDVVAVFGIFEDPTQIFVAAGAISAGDDVFAAASGRVAGTGTAKIGVAVGSASAAGAHIEVAPTKD